MRSCNTPLIFESAEIIAKRKMGNLNSNDSSPEVIIPHNGRILLSMSSVGAAAIVVCIFALIMALKFKLHKFFIHRLAIYQVLSASLYSIVCVMEVIFINYDDSSTYHILCIIEGFLLEYTLWIKLMFTFCLTFHLFCFSVFHVKFARLEVFYVLASVLGPLLFIWIPFVSINGRGITYGLAGAWCWIRNWQNNNASQNLEPGEIEQYTLLYGPAISGLMLCGVAVLVIAVVLICRAYNCKCCHQNNDDEFQPLLINGDRKTKKKILREILPLIIYPILSFMFYIPAFTNRLIGSKDEEPNETSFMWSAISLPLVGLLAGVSLIVHIFILKCPRNDKPPPATTTRFEPPAESELDDEIIQSTNIDTGTSDSSSSYE